MHLLEPKCVVQDEGIWRAVTFACNVLRKGEARRPVLTMRRVFRKYHEYLAAGKHTTSATSKPHFDSRANLS